MFAFLLEVNLNFRQRPPTPAVEPVELEPPLDTKIVEDQAVPVPPADEGTTLLTVHKY